MALPYYRRNLYVLWLSTFLVAASWTQVIPFLPLFLQQMGVTENLNLWSGLAVSAHFVSGIFMQPIWGKFGDRFGRRPMLIRAGLSLSVLYFLTSLATEPWHVVVLRFLNGSLSGFIPMSVALVGTNTPPQYSTRFVASVQTSAASGTIIGPVIGGTLAAIFGVRGALTASAVLVFISTLLTVFFVRERHRPQTSEPTSIVADLRTALRSPVLWIVLFTGAIGQSASQAIQPVLVLHVEELLGANASAFLTGVILALPGIAFVLSATRWVRLLDRRNVRQVLVLAFIGAGAGYVLSGLAGVIWLFVPVFFVASLFVAAFRPVGAAMITRDVDAGFRGRAFGLQSSATTLGGLIGPLLAGVIADFFSRGAVFVVMGIILLFGPFVLRRYDRKSAGTTDALAIPTPETAAADPAHPADRAADPADRADTADRAADSPGDPDDRADTRATIATAPTQPTRDVDRH